MSGIAPRRSGRIAAVCAPPPGCLRSPYGYRSSTARMCSTWTQRATQPAGADASFTRRPGRVCAILTADCLPVLLASDSGAGVAAAHAGWRGLAAGVIEATVRALALAPAVAPGLARAGHRSRAFRDRRRKSARSCCAPTRKPKRRSSRTRAADTWPISPRSRAAGSSGSALRGSTAAVHALTPLPEDYFSYRRDGRTGRQATLIWLEK